ncbi:MAG TPA: glycosyltransferase [Pyrinomonadaceae bacterium]|nr:glycosyltransferase [Pyrinomonadaceae bacterium]
MQTFFEWFRTRAIDKGDPWLVLGKGPSFSRRDSYDLGQFHTLSLNHAVREQFVRVAHMIDYDVVDACAEAIGRNAELLVMPWRPHVDYRPGARNLLELAAVNPTLRLMNERGRLAWYNLSTTQEKHGDSPVVHARFFSAEAALNLLAHAGVREVRSLGVDGGSAYSPAFDDLKDKTLLSGGQASFDPQFEEFAKIILSTGIDYAPLDTEAPIRVYVGATEAQALPLRVLEYSIRKHASMSIKVFPLHRAGVEIPRPADEKNRPRTPFSFQRFLIPELAGRRGRALYLDSDMLVFKDIRRLWNLPFDGADLLAARAADGEGRRPQFSVMLLDCEALRWDVREIVESLDSGELTYERLMFEMPVAGCVRASIEPAWNSLERFRRGETALLHYTDMERQPWVSRLNPLNRLWTRELLEAVDGGHITRGEVEEQVGRGHVRPSLLRQLDERITDSRRLSGEARALDRTFIPPAGVAGQGRTFGQRVKNVLKTLLVPPKETPG